MIRTHSIGKLLDIVGLIGLPTAFYLYARLHPQPAGYFELRQAVSHAVFIKPAQVVGVWMVGSMITHILFIGAPWISDWRWIYTILVPVLIILTLLVPFLLLLLGNILPEVTLILGGIYALISLEELYHMYHPSSSLETPETIQEQA